ncbi:MAG: hypothetical protein DMG50_29960 [Acidobacteria bacterium]|nr:MAG: hypothetical protein DMG50_29960 [Acidobacteriota bacterium]
MLNAECFCFASNKSGVVVRLYNIFTTSGAERSSQSRRQARDQEDEEEENDANAVNRGLLKHGGLIGRSRPDANRGSDRRIMAEV